MPVNRTHIAKTQIFKKCAFINKVFHFGFYFKNPSCERFPDKRNMVNQLFGSRFKAKITGLGAKHGKITRNRAYIFRNGHFVVV